MDKELYEKALQIVITEKKASVVFLQRKLRIGYKIADEFLNIMEISGIISQPNNLGKRTVLVSEIPDSIKTNQKKEQKQEITWWQTLIVISFFISILYLFVSCSYTIITAPEDKSSKYAYFCQNIALNELKYPSKAKITELKWNWDKNKQNFYVFGSYEAMNTFGAMIPGSFTCSFDKDFNLIHFNNK